MTLKHSNLALVGSVIAGLVTSVNLACAACPGANQQEMNQCAEADYQKADAELTKVYAKLDKTPELRAAERAWIAYRDAECTYETADNRGGSMEPMIYSGCMATMTKQRIAVLKAGS